MNLTWINSLNHLLACVSGGSIFCLSGSVSVAGDTQSFNAVVRLRTKARAVEVSPRYCGGELSDTHRQVVDEFVSWLIEGKSYQDLKDEYGYVE